MIVDGCVCVVCVCLGCLTVCVWVIIVDGWGLGGGRVGWVCGVCFVLWLCMLYMCDNQYTNNIQLFVLCVLCCM